jgi:hypothetical protein
MDVLYEVQKKIAALHLRPGMSCRAVLIHVNGVTQNLIDEDYFSNIIDFSEMLS